MNERFVIGKPALIHSICVVELSLLVELIQPSIVQLQVQREIIFMTPEQTVQLMNLFTNKRKASGFSVAEVAQRADVDRGTVWRLEQGMIASPKAESLQAIGKVLDIPSIDLYAIVGWISSGELPSFGPYLQAKYPQLPEKARQEFEDVARRYGIHLYGNDGQHRAASTSSDTLDSPQKEV